MNKKAIIVLTICALFLFYKYITQLFPSLIGNELIISYGYDGVMLAIMASSYYYSYTFMQILAGFIIDRYSVRIPIFLAILTIALMLLIFTHTSNFYLMCICRALMGVGTSFATVFYMKCAAYYTSSKTFGIISSFLATATMLGAACGGAPIGMLFQKFGWHQGLNMVAVIGLIMALIVIIFSQNSKIANHQANEKNNFINLKKVITKKENWLLFLYSGLTFSPITILGGLWGTPFLMTKYSITTQNASMFLSIMFVGHAIGSPLWAIASAKFNRQKELMYVANIVSLLSIICIIYVNFSYINSLILFFVFGFSVGCFMLSFEICREINALYVMGLSVAFINSGEGLVSAIVEPVIGYLLDTYKVDKSFTLINYQTALFILPCCFILSTVVLIFINQKNKLKNEISSI
jgi:MFS family permease